MLTRREALKQSRAGRFGEPDPDDDHDLEDGARQI